MAASGCALQRAVDVARGLHREGSGRDLTLLRVVIAQYRWAFMGVIVLSLASAGLGIGVIAYINQRLIAHSGMQSSDFVGVLPEFLVLILLLLAVTLGAQLALTTLGHHFVHGLRGRVIKQILDTDIERLEQLGSANLLASLSSDIRNITLAFVRLPELVQGIVLTIGAVVYLGWLSPWMMLVTAAWVTLTILGGSWLVTRVYRHLAQVREAESRLYANYEAVIDGRKELALNRARAREYFDGDYSVNARDYQRHVVRADTYHLSAVNFSNIMMLGAIGIVFYLANGLGWASSNVAATYSLTLLFLRTPLIQAVGALPTLLGADVAFGKLRMLALAPVREEFAAGLPTANCHTASRVSAPWQTLSLKDVSFTYADQQGEQATQAAAFSVGPLNLTLLRGELVFLIGGNGSGKSTLAKLLTGLYRPTSGALLRDGDPVDEDEREAWRQQFSAVFTDFHQFDRLLGPSADSADPALVEQWLGYLHMREKLVLEGDRVINTALSQGQRKRLALLMAVAESRDILLLDEWAADQDPQFRRVFYRDLLPRLREMGKTVFAISHDDHYFQQADRLFEMRSGKLQELSGAQREHISRDAVARLDEV